MPDLRIERSVVMPRPVAEVFRYLADFSTTAEWDPGTHDAVKVTPGAVGLGSVFDLTLNSLGRRVPMRATIATHVPDERLVVEGRGDGFTATDRLRFVALNADTTQLHYIAEITLDALPRLARPFLQHWGCRLGDAAMDGLRRALVEDGIECPGPLARINQRLVLPGMRAFTRAGYAAQHSRGLSRFMDGRTVAITGPTSGLGLAAAKLLARLGAHLVLVGRDRGRLETAAEAVRAVDGRDAVTLLEADLSLIAEGHRLADEIMVRDLIPDVWINNAGALFAERGETAEGHERALAVNLLVPALLCARLGPALAARGGRLINVVSGGLYLQGLKLDDLQYRNGSYDGAKAYARAKRGLLALTRHWAGAPTTSGTCWHAMHPGWADTPGVAQSLPGFYQRLGTRLRTPAQGADTMVWLASHPEGGNPKHSGRFWFDRAPRPEALLPGTAVSTDDTAALLAQLQALQVF